MMTTADTIQRPATAPQPRTTDAGIKLTLPRLIRSEWIKLISLRSSWFSAALVLFVSLAIVVMYALSQRSFLMEIPDLDGNLVLAGAVTTPGVFTVLFAAILGAILITGEYSTGMIRSTMTADPDRVRSLIAKAIVLAGFILVLSLITSVISLLLALALLSGTGVSYDFGTPGTALLPYLYTAGYLVALALMGLGVGYLIRNAAGAISIVVAVIFVLPIVAGMLFNVESLQWLVDASQYLPLNAGGTLISDPTNAEPGLGIALALWALVPLIGGAIVLRVRDA